MDFKIEHNTLKSRCQDIFQFYEWYACEDFSRSYVLNWEKMKDGFDILEFMFNLFYWLSSLLQIIEKDWIVKILLRMEF